MRHAVTFVHIADRTGRDNVFPGRLTAPGAWNNMVEGQFLRRKLVAAILARPAIPQEDVEPCEGRFPDRGDVFLQGDNAGHPHFKAG